MVEHEVRYLCPMCLKVFSEYPSNSVCPRCCNEDDFIIEVYYEDEDIWVEVE